ncbi:CHAD domain-containing protein [Limibaculum sp. M0105]|uniref:CHAD domain-containing protein n=1 Tax=Thermohalobaculum xanthum TaxID=2753746 RepID=A0A8J7SFK0_9RHOB|nr:CHAD domain-containing protein [Thermohalobaculum xanthum]MBK0401327.1 CHAD domain-containing protein [Thermohalobaculum xanthum]
MPYRLKHGENSMQTALRRIADEQIGRAVGEVDDTELGLHETVHQIRKRCKKLRGLIRLVRPSFARYSEENAGFRDVAKRLSHLRDAKAAVESYDPLVERFDAQVDRKAFAAIRQRLSTEQNELAQDGRVEADIARFRKSMIEAKGRASNWSLDAEGFDAVRGGIAKTYKRARKAIMKATNEPTPQNLHDWRKRVKYHWYHARLMRPLWRRMMEPHADAAKRLSDILGDHHDFHVLCTRLRDSPPDFGDAKDIEVFLALSAGRQRALEDDAFNLGQMLLAASTSELVDRWSTWWKVEFG